MNEWVLVAAIAGGMFLLMGGGGLLLAMLRGVRKDKTS
jgi:hypothetical protein